MSAAYMSFLTRYRNVCKTKIPTIPPSPNPEPGSDNVLIGLTTQNWRKNEKDTFTSLCSFTSCKFVWLRFNNRSLESFFIFTRSFFITKKKYAPHVNHYYSHVRWNYQVSGRSTREKTRKTFGENIRNDQNCYRHHLEQILGISFQKFLVVTTGLIIL